MFGRVIGGFIGLAVASDIIGAVIGFCIGFVVDSYFINIEKQQRVNDSWQTEFSYLFILLHAKFAKIDGQVTSDEVRAFQEMISVPKEDMETVRALYNIHRKSSDGFENVAVRLSEMLLTKKEHKRFVLESLCVVGRTNGDLSLYQGAFVQAVGRILAFNDSEIDGIKKGVGISGQAGGSGKKKTYSRSSGDASFDGNTKAFKMLGLKTSATKEEIRSAYKKSIKKYHPDKLRGEGASDKKVKAAENKLSKINEAYALLTGKNG